MNSPQSTQLRATLTVTNALIKFKRAQRDALDFSSGGAPITHPSLCGQGATCARRVPLRHGDRFVCTGAVDVPKLLRGSRASLLNKAEFLGANVLVEEHWVCRIRIPRNRRDGKFRVQIRYYASASRSSVPDPQRPVALDQVTNVPGLMTILEREEIFLSEYQ